MSPYTRRYSPMKKRAILAYAETHGVQAAASHFNVSDPTIYTWRKNTRKRIVKRAARPSLNGHGEMTTDQIRALILAWAMAQLSRN